MPSTPEFQHTLGKAASFSGTALHTGEKVTLKLQPAPVDHGIKFKRKDLQEEPTIDAKIENLKTVERATTIGEGSVRVHTVEHVLAALWAMGVDNAVVEMDANEPPIGDGSAQAYVDLIRKAGVTAQEEPRKFFDVRGDAVLSKEPLRFADEFVRHKILDIIGDLALVGRRIRGHVVAVKPGHASNAELARSITREQTRRSAVATPRTIPSGDGGLDTDEVMQILPHRFPF